MKLTGGEHRRALYAVAPDDRRVVVAKGHDTGNSDVVLAEVVLTRAEPEGRD